MFSKLTPWFQIQDCRIPQFVDPCSCQGWRSVKGQEGDLVPCSPTAECIQIRGHWKPTPLTNIGEVAKSDNPDPLLKQGYDMLGMTSYNTHTGCFCSSQPSMVHWLSSPIFPFCSFVVPPWWHLTKSPLLLPLDPQTHTFSESLW